MKKRVLFLAFSLLFALPAFSQFGFHYTQGYMFGNNIPVYGGSVYVNDATSQEFNALFRLDRDNAVGFTYSFQNNTADVRSFEYPDERVGLTWQYYLVDFQRYFRKSGSRFEPFAGAKIGFVNIRNNEQYGRSYTYFTVGLDLGARMYLTEHIGLSVGGQLLMPIQGLGGTIFVGSGGSGVGVSGYSAIAQFGLNIGAFVQL
jgi:hypothetical protein